MTRNYEVAGLIPGLAQWVKDASVAVSCGVGHRRGLDLALLWLWCRLVTTAPIRPPAWEPPYATDTALEKTKRQKKKKEKKKINSFLQKCQDFKHIRKGIYASRCLIFSIARLSYAQRIFFLFKIFK